MGGIIQTMFPGVRGINLAHIYLLLSLLSVYYRLFLEVGSTVIFYCDFTRVNLFVVHSEKEVKYPELSV